MTLKERLTEIHKTLLADAGLFATPASKEALDELGRIAEAVGANTKVPFRKPALDEIRLLAAKAGLPPQEAEKFWAYYESNGWMVGRNPMKSVAGALANWRLNWQERKFATATPIRIGTPGPVRGTLLEQETDRASKRLSRLVRPGEV